MLSLGYFGRLGEPVVKQMHHKIGSNLLSMDNKGELLAGPPRHLIREVEGCFWGSMGRPYQTGRGYRDSYFTFRGQRQPTKSSTALCLQSARAAGETTPAADTENPLF